MKLTKEDFYKIKKTQLFDTVSLSTGSYYVKNTSDGINDLIGARLAKEFNIICPDYYIIKVNGGKYLLSFDLNNLGEFQTFYDLDVERSDSILTLYDIWDFFEKRNNYTYNFYLMTSIVKIYIFDILFVHWDRNLGNIGIIKIENKEEIAILDNEYVFSTDFPQNIVSYLDSDDMNICNENIREESMKDFINFLKYSSEEFIELFKYYYDLMNVEYFRNILDEVEQQNKIITENGEEPVIISNKEEIIGLYRENYDLIGEIWKELYHGRK